TGNLRSTPPLQPNPVQCPTSYVQLHTILRHLETSGRLDNKRQPRSQAVPRWLRLSASRRRALRYPRPLTQDTPLGRRSRLMPRRLGKKLPDPLFCLLVYAQGLRMGSSFFQACGSLIQRRPVEGPVSDVVLCS